MAERSKLLKITAVVSSMHSLDQKSSHHIFIKIFTMAFFKKTLSNYERTTGHYESNFMPNRTAIRGMSVVFVSCFYLK